MTAQPIDLAAIRLELIPAQAAAQRLWKHLAQPSQQQTEALLLRRRAQDAAVALARLIDQLTDAQAQP